MSDRVSVDSCEETTASKQKIDTQRIVIKLSKVSPVGWLVVVGVVLIVGMLLGKSFFSTDSRSTVASALTPLEAIETFEISALEYRYRNIVFEENTEERKFIFIPLEPAVKRYAVQYDGAIRLGIDAKEIKVNDEGPLLQSKKTLTVTIPNAHILSHEAPLNDTVSVIFDEADHTEKFSLGQYANTLSEKKKETEAEMNESGLLEQAQENAKRQLESFLRALPDIEDNYTLVFVLE